MYEKHGDEQIYSLHYTVMKGNDGMSCYQYPANA
jgi:hypothetical protein